MPHPGLAAFAVLAILPALSAAEPDWPQWRGPNRDGIWPVRNFPATLPKERPAVWRKPIGGGFGGIAVADDRVFLLDRQTTPREVERVVCLNLAAGAPDWVRDYPVTYGGLDYGNGPRSTPTVFDGRVYTFGALG